MNEKYHEKYYVGSDSIFRPKYHSSTMRNEAWVRNSLDEAVDQAKEILTADSTKTEVFIVKIVKVVRRQTPPIVVEDV